MPVIICFYHTFYKQKNRLKGGSSNLPIMIKRIQCTIGQVLDPKSRPMINVFPVQLYFFQEFLYKLTTIILSIRKISINFQFQAWLFDNQNLFRTNQKSPLLLLFINCILIFQNIISISKYLLKKTYSLLFNDT